MSRLMRRLLGAGFVIAALIGGGFLFKTLFVMSLADTSDPRAHVERGAFERFEHENVQIYVQRFDENIPRFTGDIVEGRLFVEIQPTAGLQLEGVSTGCGCSVLRPVEGKQNSTGDELIEMAFFVNTIGRVGPQDFPLTFKFRDLNGKLSQYQARLQFVLERGIEIPSNTEAVLLEDGTETFSRTFEIRSKIPDIQWESVNVIVTGGKADISLNPRGKQDGVSVAEVALAGRVSDISSGELTIVFESSQFKEQPRIVIPFVKPGEQLVWKPESLEFRDPQALPKLIVRTRFGCSVDELSLDVDSEQLKYQIKKLGQLFVVDFQVHDATSPSEATPSSGIIRVLHKGVVAAEVPYRWSGT